MSECAPVEQGGSRGQWDAENNPLPTVPPFLPGPVLPLLCGVSTSWAPLRTHCRGSPNSPCLGSSSSQGLGQLRATSCADRAARPAASGFPTPASHWGAEEASSFDEIFKLHASFRRRLGRRRRHIREGSSPEAAVQGLGLRAGLGAGAASAKADQQAPLLIPSLLAFTLWGSRARPLPLLCALGHTVGGGQAEGPAPGHRCPRRPTDWSLTLSSGVGLAELPCPCLGRGKPHASSGWPRGGVCSGGVAALPLSISAHLLPVFTFSYHPLGLAGGPGRDTPGPSALEHPGAPAQACEGWTLPLAAGGLPAQVGAPCLTGEQAPTCSHSLKPAISVWLPKD